MSPLSDTFPDFHKDAFPSASLAHFFPSRRFWVMARSVTEFAAAFIGEARVITSLSLTTPGTCHLEEAIFSLLPSGVLTHLSGRPVPRVPAWTRDKTSLDIAMLLLGQGLKPPPPPPQPPLLLLLLLLLPLVYTAITTSTAVFPLP